MRLSCSSKEGVASLFWGPAEVPLSFFPRKSRPGVYPSCQLCLALPPAPGQETQRCHPGQSADLQMKVLGVEHLGLPELQDFRSQRNQPGRGRSFRKGSSQKKPAGWRPPCDRDLPDTAPAGQRLRKLQHPEDAKRRTAVPHGHLPPPLQGSEVTGQSRYL